MNPANLFNSYRRSINPPYKQKDLITIGTTLLVLLILPFTVFAVLNVRSLDSKATTNQLAAGEKYLSPIMSANNDQDSARLYGDKVLFYNYNLGSCCQANLTLYDLKTKTSTIIATTNRGTNDAPLPSMSGNYIVWDDAHNGDSWNMDVWLYDLSTNTKRALFSQTYHETHPSISGSKVAWLDGRNGNAEVYVYDLSTAVEKRITNSPSDKSSVEISGNRIIWWDQADRTVHLYDLSANTDRTLASRAVDPSISGNTVVWDASGSDGTNYTNEIYSYDINTNTTRRLTYTSSASMKIYLDISGNLIAWIDYRNEPGGGGKYINGDIYAYDLTLNEEFRVTYDTTNQIKPSVSGSRIVWTDLRSGHKNIYLYDPPAGFIPPSVPNSPTPTPTPINNGSSSTGGGTSGGSSKGTSGSSGSQTSVGQGTTAQGSNSPGGTSSVASKSATKSAPNSSRKKYQVAGFYQKVATTFSVLLLLSVIVVMIFYYLRWKKSKKENK